MKKKIKSKPKYWIVCKFRDRTQHDDGWGFSNFNIRNSISSVPGFTSAREAAKGLREARQTVGDKFRYKLVRRVKAPRC